MSWQATDELTLILHAPNDAAQQRAASALAALAAVGEVEAAVAEQLGQGLRALALQVTSLDALGRLCHQHDAARGPAREVSQALFGMVLPTPGLAQASDYFWRVARAIGAVSFDESKPGPVGFRVFDDRAAAAAFATEVGAGLITITESAAASLTITVWFR